MIGVFYFDRQLANKCSYEDAEQPAHARQCGDDVLQHRGTDPAAGALCTQRLDMARELFERLVTVFDCAKADGRIAPSFGCVQLAQGNHSLAVALLVESDRRPKPPRIVRVIRSMIDLDQGRWLDTTELHAVGIAPAIGRNHVEAP